MKKRLLHLRRRESAQGMVEFALVLPLLLVLMFGLIEVGRLLVIYTSVSTASREGARYASAAGRPSPSAQYYYMDHAGIRAAARRVLVFVGVPDDDIDITYDAGPGTTCFTPTGLGIIAGCSTQRGVRGGDRVNVVVSADYVPLLGLVPGLQGFTITSESSRTIVKEIAIEVSTTTTDTPPVVTITAPPNGSEYLAGDPITFVGEAYDEPDGDLSVELKWFSDRDGQFASGSTVVNYSTLSVGLHTITAKVVDSTGNEGSASIIIRVYDDTPPTVIITAPNNNSQYYLGTNINFAGTADDTKDGDLTGNLVWTSNLDGNIGTGGGFSISSLSAGVHTITASVTDSDGRVGSASITVTIVQNSAPVVTINSPSGGSSFYAGQAITFSGSAIDAEDGNLSAGLRWVSSRDGVIGNGPSFSKSNLSVGSHTITASATDPGGLTGSASITIDIEISASNNPPQVNITAPADGSSFNQYASVAFTGSAIDIEDGNISAQLTWTSSINGTIGTGPGFAIATLSPGTHVITAQATDSGMQTGSDSITVIILANTAPTVQIILPTSGSTFVEGTPITFRATASDPQDGDLSNSIQWTSSINGSLGSGSGFSLTNLSPGSHTITARVTDSGGLTATASVTINIIAQVCPTAPYSPDFGGGGSKEILIWDIYRTSSTPAIDLNYLEITWPNNAGKRGKQMLIVAIAFNGSDIYTANPGASPPSLVISSVLWSGLFSNNPMKLEIIFNNEPGQNVGAFTIKARFGTCNIIQGSKNQ